MNVSNAAVTSQQAKFNQLFTHLNKPPRGFEVLAKEQKIVIDVYYLDRFLGVTELSVNVNTVQFIKPEDVLHKIGDLKNPDDVLAKLRKSMKTNSHLLCNQEVPEHCNQLSPKIVGIIYDPDFFRVYLFINPRYLSNTQNAQWLSPSTVGLSYLNNIYMAADSGNRNLPFLNVNKHSNNLFNTINNLPLYNLTSDNTVAYKNTRLNMSASFANRANFDNVFNENDIQLNTANIAHTYKNYEYTAGLIEIPSTIFFSSNAILGAEVKTTLNTLRDKSAFLATPITFFLPVAATVSLLQGSRIIYTAKLPAGNQKIDTSAFPQGSYPVTMRINDVQGGDYYSDQNGYQFRFVSTRKYATKLF